MTEKTSGGVSLDKTSAPAADATAGFGGASGVAAKPRRGLFGGSSTATGPVRHVPVPRSINVAVAGLALAVLGMLVQAVSFMGFDGTLTDLIKQNAKDQKKTLTASGITSDLHSLRMQSWLTFGLLTVVLALLAYSLRRTRSASGSRWALLVALVLTRLPFYIIPSKGLPVPVQVGFVMTGIGSIVAIIFVFFVRQSQQYFRDCRAALNPDVAAGIRPSLGSIFAARRTRTTPGFRTSAPPPAPPAAGAATPRTRAKVRADAEAVAKGAELARTRAKATKSRRSE